MPATIHLPKSANDVRLVYAHVAANVTIVDADAGFVAMLELDGQKIEGNNSVSKYLAAHVAEKQFLGASDIDRAEVNQWLSWTNTSLKVASEEELNSELKFLNDHLATRTYLVGDRITLADLVVYANIYNHAKLLKPVTLPNLVRWFDLIQHVAVEGQKTLTSAFNMVEFNLDDVPPPALTAPTEDKRDKKDKKDKEKVKEAATPAAKTTAEAPKAEKKEKVKGERRQPPAPPAVDQSEFSRLDIRVGFIRSAQKHAEADSLYVEEIDLGDGEGTYRTVVSGLVNHVPIEQMQQRWCVCLANLKPASMRGVKSEAMVLCATGADGKVELLAPVDVNKVKPGDRVYIEGLEGEAEKVLNPKKKYWENVQPELNTNAERLARYKELPFRIRAAGGDVLVTVESVVDGKIK